MQNIDSYWFRVPVRNDFGYDLALQYIEKFRDIGVNCMVLPKLKSVNELREIVKKFSDIKFIVLIEHPRLLVEIRHEFIENSLILKSLVGIGLGSHDLMTLLNAEHSIIQLDYPRKEVLYTAKAYDLLAIDIASMNVSNKELFVEEVSYGKDSGYDAKFVIHPNQQLWLKDYIKNDDSLLVWAQNVCNHLPKGYNGEDIAPFILNNEVIEKPHALKAMEIIKRYNYGK